MEYFVNEGNLIGGQEPQALGTTQTKITASTAVTKGDPVEVTGSFTVGVAANESLKVVGIAQNDAEIGEEIVIRTEGFVKMTASAAIVAGVELISAGSGKVKTSAGTGKILGIALSAVAADGDIVYVKFSV